MKTFVKGSVMKMKYLARKYGIMCNRRHNFGSGLGRMLYHWLIWAFYCRHQPCGSELISFFPQVESCDCRDLEVARICAAFPRTNFEKLQMTWDSTYGLSWFGFK